MPYVIHNSCEGGITMSKNERILAEVEAARELATNILECISDAFVALDVNWRCTYMNEKAAQIFGRQREELIGKQLWTELPESIDRPLYKACHKAAETQQVILFEEYFASSDCWFENRIHPSKDGLSIFFRDITERKEAEEALRKSEHRFQTLAEVSPAGIFQTDSEGLTTYVNPRWCQISGMSKEEALGTGWLSAVHSEDKDTLSNGWERATGVHESSTAEYRFVRKDGTIAWVIGQAIPERNSENKLLGYIGTITDITDRKQTEDELKDSEARYRYLFEQNPAPMLIYELGSLSMLAVNDAFVAHYGYSKTEALALHLTDLYPLSEKKAIADLTKKLHGHAYVGEWHHLKKDGTLIAIEARSHEFSFEGRNSRIAVIIDVTERRQVEEALQKSEELYRTLFENTGTATVMIEENTIISLANAEFERLSQYSKQEIEGKKSWADFVFKEDLDRMREQYFRRREKRATALTQYEFRFVPRDGNIRTILLTIDVIPGTKRSAASLLDITKRKLTDEALRESERQISLIYDTVGDIIFNVKVEKEGSYSFTSVNRCFLSTTGLQASQIIGRRVQDIIPEPSLSLALEKYSESIRTKKIVRWEEISEYPTGRLIGEVSIAPVFDDASNCVGLVGSVHDITEHKRIEGALRQSEQRYKQLLESITDYTYSVEICGGRPVNTIHGFGCERVTGYTPSDYSANPQLWLQMVHPDDRNIVEHYADPLCEGKEIPALEHRIVHKDGSIIWVRNTYVLKRDADGKVVGYDGLISDITERKQAEEEIHRLNAELEERVIKRTAQLEAANKELEAFSYSVSHDLRAPLRHASGYVDLLLKRNKADLSEKGQHYLNAIADSVHQMGMLIDELLQFSRTGRTEMRQSNSDMNKIVQEALESLHPETTPRKVEWIIGELPSVFCDKAMLKLVWVNLLSNAFKFTRTRESARIEIGAREENTEFVFFVRDNGVGFDMQYAHKLFGVFQRLHSMEEFEGTGIGLANVRRIISRHEGRTWAEAEPDKGATFYFTLPNYKKGKS